MHSDINKVRSNIIKIGHPFDLDFKPQQTLHQKKGFTIPQILFQADFTKTNQNVHCSVLFHCWGLEVLTDLQLNFKDHLGIPQLLASERWNAMLLRKKGMDSTLTILMWCVLLFAFLMVPSVHDAMVQWCHGAMLPWCHGAMVPWSHCTMEP